MVQPQAALVQQILVLVAVEPQRVLQVQQVVKVVLVWSFLNILILKQLQLEQD
jgi:hypothetical protein